MKDTRKEGHMNKKGVIFHMVLCDFRHVGEKGRSLTTRIKEHEYSIKSRNI